MSGSKNPSLPLLLLLSLSLLSVSTTASPSLGTWGLLQRSIGISAMHMQLLRSNHVIIFDRTDFGSSNLSLPHGTPCRLGLDDVLPLDCSAHSLLFSPSLNTFRPLSRLKTDVFCSSGAVDPGGTLVQTGGYLAGDRTVRVFAPCPDDDDVAECDWSELRQRLAVRRWYATNQILPDGRVIVVGGRKQFSYEFFPKSATSAESHFTFLENATSAASDFSLPKTAMSATSDNRLWKTATSAAFDYSLLKPATSVSAHGFPKSASSSPGYGILGKTAASGLDYGIKKPATSASDYGLPETATSAAPAYRPTATTPDSIYSLPFLKTTTDPIEENNLYPFLHLLPNGDLFIFANRRSIQLNHKLNKIVREFPPIPGEKRNYPSSGSSVLLPLRGSRPDPEVMVCGGAPDGAYYMSNNMSVYVSASNTCGRLRLTGLDPSWVMERMPMNRVMSDMLLLPTGDVLIINGASNGTAGWEDAIGPVLNPVLYNPTRRKFTVLNPTVIPRMYHSAAILLPDGRILVGGSNPHKDYNFTANNYPTDLSLEAFYPPYLSPDHAHLRPSILSIEIDNKIVSYGHNFSLTFVGPFRVFDRALTASLIAPPFTTHAFAMNQRLIFLDVIESIQRLPLFGYKVMLRGPSSANIAPPGYYMLFLVHVGVPGECVWVKVEN